MMITEGFLGQRLRVLPQPLVSEALASPITDHLLVTDAGHFPHAAAHGRARATGAAQHVLIFCAAGRGWLRMKGDVVPVRPGDMVIVPARRPHEYGADDSDPWSIWWLHITGADADTLVAKITGNRSSLIFSVHDTFSAKSLIEHAILALERDDTVSSLYAAAGAAWNLLAQLASESTRGTPATSDRIRVAQDYLRENLRSTTSITELAALAGLSTSHFSALFKRATGIGVTEYVKRLRSARARELLITTDASVAEIARSIGYADPFYFSRQFRAVNGTSPSEYRAEFRGAARS